MLFVVVTDKARKIVWMVDLNMQLVEMAFGLVALLEMVESVDVLLMDLCMLL